MPGPAAALQPSGGTTAVKFSQRKTSWPRVLPSLGPLRIKLGSGMGSLWAQTNKNRSSKTSSITLTEWNESFGCSKAKIQEMVYSLRQVALIAEAGRIADFDEEHACLLAQIMDGVNEVRPLFYPTPQQIWALSKKRRPLMQTLEQKKEALAQCRGASIMEDQE